MKLRSRMLRASSVLLIAAVACEDTVDPTENVVCDDDNGGITLPDGFCAAVVADLVSGGEPARARHMAITSTGDLFVAINSP